ncbi:MAG: SDR family oxidoreductase [Lachnospiraceae bacterium]|jgi:NAD(P)-dependent dehydrogenase (short-subunit alcohol dehydrogenase family)|nr:SDR family oxidoreductase [Lachnospiraceae bacterium]
MKSIKGKVALVTGAGRGIGRQIAIKLAGCGAKVICVSRTLKELDQTISLIKRDGGEGEAFLLDLTVLADIEELRDVLIEKYGQVDILINNAGGYPKEVYQDGEEQALNIWEWEEKKWDTIIETNTKIPFLVTKTFVPQMIERKSGDVIFISSRMGRIPSQMGAYAMAKSGIVTMSDTLALQVKEYGIRSNCVAPGILDTPGQRVYNKSVGQEGIEMGDSRSVADAVVYLLCYAPSNMTGQVLDLWSKV